MKRLRAAGGYIPIQPKPVPIVSTSTNVGTERRKNAATPVVMPTNHQSPISGNPGNESSVLLLPAGPLTAMDLSSSSVVVSAAETCQPSQSYLNMVPQNQVQSSTETQLTASARNFVEMLTQNQSPLSTVVSQIATTLPLNYSSANVVAQSHLPSTIRETELRPPLFSRNTMTTLGPLIPPSIPLMLPTTTMIPNITTFPATSSFYFPIASQIASSSQLPSTICGTELRPQVLSTNAMITPGPPLPTSIPLTLPTTMAPSVTMTTFQATPSPSTTFSNTELRPPTFDSDGTTTRGQSLSHSGAMTIRGQFQSPGVLSTVPETVVPSVAMAASGPFPLSVSTSMSPVNSLITQGSNIVHSNNFGINSDIFQADVNTGESSTTRGNEVVSNDMLQRILLYLQSSGLDTLADATVERGPLQEAVTNDAINLTTPLVQVGTILTTAV